MTATTPTGASDPSAGASDPSASASDRRTMVELDRPECERLLAEALVGRIGFNFAGHPVILPVTFRFFDGEIIFRTGTGQKLHGVAADKPVAFEVDKWDAWERKGWSVLVSGTASEIIDYEDFMEAEELNLQLWADSEDQDRWVRIIPNKVTGRRLQ